MHLLRARVFVGRLGWQVKIKQGRERDEYCSDLRRLKRAAA
jgi:acyl homoserine lactone synthase